MNQKYIWVVVGVLAVLFYFLKVPSSYIIGLTLITWLIAFVYEQTLLENKLAALQNQLVDVQKLTEPPKPSYRLNVTVLPNWDAILEKLTVDNKISRDDLLDKMKKSDQINPGGWGLCYQGFRFVYFKDNISGMCQIWSDHYRTFVEDMEVEGWIFEKGQMNYDFSDSIHLRWIFSPESMGIENKYSLDGMGEELGKMPFWDIIRFLLELEGGHLSTMYAIKTFPDKLQAKLDETGTKYPIEDSGLWVLDEFNKEVFTMGGNNQWTGKYEVQAYDQIIPFHEFENAYYTVHIRIETFQK